MKKRRAKRKATHPRPTAAQAQGAGQHTIGMKVAAWLQSNRSAVPPIEPSSEKRLAALIGVAQTTLNSALKRWGGSRVRADIALGLSRAMKVSVDNLLDPEQPYPPRGASSGWRAFEQTLSEAERDLLVRAWSPSFVAAARAFSPKRGPGEGQQ